MHIAESSPRPVYVQTPHPCTARRQMVRVAGLTYGQAKGLLHWIADHGCKEVEVELDDVGFFVVRFAPTRS